MKINFLGLRFNVKLSEKILNQIEADPFIENRYFVFLPKSQLCRLHRMLIEEDSRLPKNRESLLEFDKDFTNATLNINGSTDMFFYRELITDIEFTTESEKKRISAILNQVA